MSSMKRKSQEGWLATVNRSCVSICVTKSLFRAGSMVNRKNFLSSSLIIVQNLVAVSHPVCVHLGNSKNLTTLGHNPLRMGGVADHLETRFSPTCFTMPNLVVLCQTLRAYIQRSARENGPLAFQLLWSIQVTGTDTDRSATYDFSLVIQSNHGPTLYRF